MTRTAIDLKRNMASSILLAGGSSMFPGFKTRLFKDLSKLYDQNVIKKHGGKTRDPIRFKIEDYGLRKPLLAYNGCGMVAMQYPDKACSSNGTNAELVREQCIKSVSLLGREGCSVIAMWVVIYHCVGTRRRCCSKGEDGIELWGGNNGNELWGRGGAATLVLHGMPQAQRVPFPRAVPSIRTTWWRKPAPTPTTRGRSL